MQRSSVVFPLPDGPMTLTTSPRAHIEIDPSITDTAPKLFLRPLMRTTGGIGGMVVAATGSLADIGEARLEQAADADRL